MKKIIIICPGRVTSINLANQLEKIFGEYTEVQPFSIEDELDFDIKNSFVVLSSPQAMNWRVQEKIDQGMDYITARRVINHRFISELLALPKATEVLLVNDRADSTYQAITQLQALGVNYIKYYPYYPGIISYPKHDIAVTVGEPQLVPYDVKKVIDIGTRQIDITTVSDIAKKLGLMDVIGDKLSSQYIQEIIGLLNRINESAKNLKIVSSRLETIANCLTKAIIYVDKDGCIITGNQEVYNLLGCDYENIIGKNICKIIPEMSDSENRNDKVDVILVHGQELFVTAKAINQNGSEEGTIYTFEKSEEIQENEYEIRRRATKSINLNYYTFKDIIYKSKSMEKLLEKAKIFAKSDFTILIQGESGTGKELIAQAIHCASKRAEGPFVPVTFASMPMSLIESELFGYEEGSFTGAKKGGKRGLFEEAHGGTIFLDEIGDASPEFQCRLLRVIQERQVRRIGGIKQIPIDVRMIAATNRDLSEEVKKGNFRADLYYRLNVLPIRTLSLRERKSDIPVLAAFFLKKISNGMYSSINEVLDEDAIELMQNYNWPGNIRQLENAMEYIVSISVKGRKLKVQDLPEYITGNSKKRECLLLSDILGKDMLWLLNEMKNSDGLGRRLLANKAKEEGLDMTEGHIRKLISNAEMLGFAESSKGRKGTNLTEKGLKVLSEAGY